jgi:endonuclease-3
MADKNKLKLAADVRARLARAIPEPKCELDHADAWQLVIATILSAQSTDKRVNIVTKDLFARYPTPAALAAADQLAIEEVVKSTGFFRNKAKAIIAASKKIVEDHDGVVPRTIEQMVELPGVARKTANVVLGTAYGISSGFIVDTHVGRVSQRLGLTTESDPVKVEEALCGLFNRRSWIDMGHRLVLHGRYVCLSQSPRCGRCPLNELCPSAAEAPAGRWTQRAEAEEVLVSSRGEAGS